MNITNLELENFFRANIDLIDSYKFEELYQRARVFLGITIPEITKVLFEINVNPLYYMDVVPAKFYEGNMELKSIIIPDGIKTIGYHAFYNCMNLTDIELPNSVITIQGESFAGCKNFTSIIIPDSVENIQPGAFMWCDNLTNVRMGHGLKSLDYEIFYCCPNLKSITYRGTTSEWYNINKDYLWSRKSKINVIHCDDGDIEI